MLSLESANLGTLVELAARAEAAGMHGLWLGQGLGFDAMLALSQAARVTTRLSLGVSVVPTWPRHPTSISGT